MGQLIEKQVKMTPADWNSLADDCERRAVQAIHDESPMLQHGLQNAAALLRAARVFRGHANGMELSGVEATCATVEVWDLSDEEEGSESAWSEISAKLREVAGSDPKILPLVEHIDKLHELSEQRGIPTITKAELEAALESAQ